MKTLFIIDAYNLIYRMFYAVPEMHTRDGRVVNAIFWVAKFLRALADENPGSSIVVATDVGQSFRATEYSEYKAQRDRMPDNLRSQIEGVFALFDAAGIQTLSREWYEADDIIGSLVSLKSNGWTDYQFVIISSDKDLCQFVRDGHVHIYDAMKRKFMKEKDVLEKFSVPVHQVRDYLAIVWDSSDNIPGIAGFGPKKAEDLLGKYDTLEGIYRELWVINYKIWTQVQLDREKYESSDLTPKLKQWLIDNIENAFLSQRLATIITDLDVSLGLTDADTLQSHISRPEFIDMLRAYEFRSLLPRDIPQEQLSHTPKAQILEIRDISSLNMLIDSIKQRKKCSLHIASGSIYVGLSPDDLSSIRPDIVDITDLLSLLLESSDIEIHGYDLKSAIRKLIDIQKPLQMSVEGQGRLF